MTDQKLTNEERKKLLREFHWPRDLFPDKKYSSAGTMMECDFYKIPKFKSELKKWNERIN